MENLPGLPDNIRRRKEGGYWLGVAGIRKWPFSFLDFLGPYPTLRKIITKVGPSCENSILIQFSAGSFIEILKVVSFVIPSNNFKS